MSRVTYSQLKGWVASYNENNAHKIELSAFDGSYWIYDAKTHDRIAVNSSPSLTWEIFCAWKAGYRAAKEDLREETK